MGTLYSGLCETCGYGKELHLGGGLRSINLEVNAMALPENEREKLLLMAQRKEIKQFVAENYAAVCSKCHTLVEKTVIDITDIVDLQYTFGEDCKVCGNKLRLYRDIEKDKIKCPKCKGSGISLTPIGHWD